MYVSCCVCPVLCGVIPCCSQALFTVDEDEVAIVARNGKFQRMGHAGPLLLSRPCTFPIESIVGRLSTRVQQLDVTSETKTKDNAMVKIRVSVQFRLVFSDPASVEAAWYKPDDADIDRVITAHTADIARTRLAKLNIDDAFLARNELQDAIVDSLESKIREYGYRIQAVLVTDFEPSLNIKTSMNDIYVQNMLKIAAQQKAESLKTIEVTKAQAMAEKTYLLGEGTAKMREAIAVGLSSTTEQFCDALNSVDATTNRWTSDDVLYLQVLTQQFEICKAVGMSPGEKRLVIPTGPLAVKGIELF